MFFSLIFAGRESRTSMVDVAPNASDTPIPLRKIHDTTIVSSLIDWMIYYYDIMCDKSDDQCIL